MSEWQKIWNKKGGEAVRMEGRSPEEILLELKRLNGFDVSEGLSYESFYAQYTEIKERLQKYGKVGSVFEVGCGSGANLFLFEQDGVKTGGIDYSQGLVDVAKNVLATDDVSCLEAAKLSSAQKYDAVFSNSVFSYFDSEEYARTVLERMYEKSNSVIGLIDLHDIAKKDEFIAYRKTIIEDYEERYKDLPKFFYSREFFLDFAKSHQMKAELYDDDMKGYWNNGFVFSCYMYHQR